YCLMTIASFMVFYANVIAPTRQGATVGNFAKLGYAVAALAPIAALLSRGMQGGIKPSPTLTWIFLCVALLSCFVALVFGTVYRGIFRRQDRCERLRRRILGELEQLQHVPTLEDYVKWPSQKVHAATGGGVSTIL